MTLSLEGGLEYCGAKTQGSAEVNGTGLERNQSSGTLGTPNPDAVGEGVPEVGRSNFGEVLWSYAREQEEGNPSCPLFSLLCLRYGSPFLSVVTRSLPTQPFTCPLPSEIYPASS